MPETVVPPWWQTMDKDPWYGTLGKALLGEREYSELAGSHLLQGGSATDFRRDTLPILRTLAPFLLLGKGGKGPELGLPEVPSMFEPFPMGPIKTVVPPGRIPMPPEAPFVDPLSQNPTIRWPNPLAGSKGLSNAEHDAYTEKLMGDLGIKPPPQEMMTDYTQLPPLEPTQSALDDPIVQEYLQNLGVPVVEPITPLPNEPLTPENMLTIGELGLKAPPRSPAEVQADWEAFVKKMMSGGGESGDMYQMPGGTHFGGQEPPLHATQDYDYEFAPKEQKDARFMSNAVPTPPPDIDFSQYY